MLAKQYRLSTKEVNYILHRRQIISTPDLLFFHIPQYANRPYNQFAIQISTKVHKRSHKRNKIKRIYYDHIAHIDGTSSPTNKTKQFIKTIALPHKTNIEERNQLLESGDRKKIQHKLEKSIDILLKTKS